MAAAAAAAAANSWLRAQRKGDLLALADSLGLKNYEALRKTELEAALDGFISEHSSRFSHRPELTGYFNSRFKALGSPIKREHVRDMGRDEHDRGLRSARRRAAKAAEAEDMAEIASVSSDEALASSTALVRSPPVAVRIPLPATPADVADAVDRSAVALRRRASSMYQESGITEASNATRDTLSTVTSILFCVSAFELFCIRPEILSNRYAFTVPAVDLLGSSDYPVYLPDMFLLLTSGFWSPALTWALTSFVLPSVSGYFFNLNAASRRPGRLSRLRTRAAAPHAQDAVVDPLTFSITKALVSYVVYAQGATLGGLLSEASVERLNGAVYGGYKGVLVGAAITGLVSIYDAVLRR